MEIEIATVGGYEEVGRQMTAVRMDDDIVIFDMGLNLSQVLIHDNSRPSGCTVWISSTWARSPTTA